MDSRAAKRQRFEALADAATDTAAPPCPLPLALVEEYEEFVRDFWATVRERTVGGELELGAWRWAP